MMYSQIPYNYKNIYKKIKVKTIKQKLKGLAKNSQIWRNTKTFALKQRRFT